MTSSSFLLQDLKSGFLVFLIALPLCLGISMASGVPPIAGLITAMMGGIVSTFLGSSRLTIKGPAAGLIVIVLGCVQELGAGDPIAGYRRCLAVGVVAACFQIFFSWRKWARWGALMPPAVVHGMLAAIGVIILAKQTHIVLGVIPQAKTPLHLIAEIPHSILAENPLLAFLGLLTLSTIFLLPKIPSRYTKKVPPGLVALLMVIPLSFLWHLDSLENYEFMGRTYQLGSKFLVQIPNHLLSSVTFPDFSILNTFAAWKFIFMFALVGSIESVLTVLAVDSMDPEKKSSDLDRDLFSVGVGNLLAASIGGLPMISEIVRSTANIDNGARSSWSNFFHGGLILLSVGLLSGVLHEIPLSALAAMLIITGLRLASPREILRMYRIGTDQLVIFLSTMVVTLAVDLLAGVAVGVLLELSLHFYRGVRGRQFFSAHTEECSVGELGTLKLKGPAVFSNYLDLSAKVQGALLQYKKVLIDVSEASVVDHTTLERLHALSHLIGHERVSVIGLETLKGVSDHELSTRRVA